MPSEGGWGEGQHPPGAGWSKRAGEREGDIHLCRAACCSPWSGCGVPGTRGHQEPRQSTCALGSGRPHYMGQSRRTRRPTDPRHPALGGRDSQQRSGTWQRWGMARVGGGGGRSGGLQGLNSSLSPHHTHTSRAALNTLSGQVHPVHPPLGFRGGYDWGPGRSFWATARFASTLPKVFFSSSMPHPTRGPPPEGAIPRHTGGLQGSSWVASPMQDVSPGPGQSRERLRRAGPPPGTRQLWEQADQGAQGVQPGTSARKKVGG